MNSLVLCTWELQGSSVTVIKTGVVYFILQLFNVLPDYEGYLSHIYFTSKT